MQELIPRAVTSSGRITIPKTPIYFFLGLPSPKY